MKVTVFAHALDEVVKRLNRLRKKAFSYGVPFNHTIGETRFVTVKINEVDPITKSLILVKETTVEGVDIEITDNLVKKDGWSVLAHIEHGVPTNLITPIGHKDLIPHEWLTLPGNCQHCNTKHHRKATYLVEREGEVIQVGTSCLKDYTGISPQLITSFATVLENVIIEEPMLDCEMLREAPRTYEAIQVIATAYDDIQRFGYRKDGVTRDSVILNMKEGMKPSMEGLEAAQSFMRFALNCAELIDMDIPSFYTDYAAGAAFIIRNGWCKRSQFGRLVYLPEAFSKEMDLRDQRASKAALAALTRHYGEVGQRVTVSVSCKCLTSFETDWGCTYINKMVDTEGNIFIWKTGRSLNGELTITGTIKEHNEFNGEKQTVLTRCKVAS